MATAEQIRQIEETSLHGGHLALDFVNTVDWRLTSERVDLVADHELLCRWARRLGVLSEKEFGALMRESRRHPRKAQAAVEYAVEVRETLYRIVAAVADERPPAPEDLQALNAVYADAVAHAQLVASDDGFAWSWEDADPWRRVVGPVAVAAMELLSADLVRIKQCHDEGCGWVFLDMSKNVSRRWCSMQGCGTRAKMRRQYERKKTPGRARSG